MSDDTGASPQMTYAKQVGTRLRAIRRQQGLSLQDVESVSSQEFKASVVGAYERGERVISVPRLHRLARFYHVPVDQLLPSRSDGGADAADGDDLPPPPTREGVTFDLVRLAEIDDPQLRMVHRYLEDIALRRQDFNGRVMTIRGEDVRAIAGLFGTDVSDLLRRLDDLQLRVPAKA